MTRFLRYGKKAAPISAKRFWCRRKIEDKPVPIPEGRDAEVPQPEAGPTPTGAAPVRAGIVLL